MSYIIPSTSPFVSIKLTEVGRSQLAQGQLTFGYWGIGDSEINYDREAIVDANQSNASLSGASIIFRPFDYQPNIKSYITPSGATTPFIPLDSSNINVLQAVVNNAADERGFFTGGTTGSTISYTTLTANTYTPYVQLIANTYFTGGTTLSGFSSTSGVSTGDILLVKLTNDTVTGFTVNNNSVPIPHLWFKVQAKTSNTVTVDRALPNNSNNTSSSSEIIIYRGGEVYNTIGTGNTTAYWDSGTLSFDSASNVTCHDVPVWNMNNVWCENLAGMTGLTTTALYEDYTYFGSYQYLGTKNPYLEFLCETTATTQSLVSCNGSGFSYPDTISKSVSILHYTNNTISNLYGEFFFIDTTNDKMVRITLPDLMYHRANYATSSGTSMGMSFISSGTTQFVGNSDITFIDLIEDPNMISSGNTALVIGKVYPQLKIVVITDDDIVAAMSYKSNRNWTLPALSATLSSPSGGTSTGVLDVNYTMYLTYSLENNTTSGLTTSLPCQNYVMISNTTSSAKDISFKISDVDLLPYMRKIEKGGYDGIGFNARKFKLVYQIVSDPSVRPDPNTWKVYDYTSTAITTVAGQTIDPILLENQIPTTNGFILTSIVNSAATQFDITQSLSMAPKVSPSALQFGDERFFYGNLSTYIGATIFKTLFDIRVNSGQFNFTSNPTMDQTSTTPPNIKVSEVGIYDTNFNLVVIGKLSTPVALLPGNTVMLELSLDF